MALQVWLPLNENFNNRGLDNSVSVTATNVTITSGGKTGHCAQVTSSKKIAIGAKSYMSPNGSNEMSISMWVNATTFNYLIAFGSFELRMTASLAQFRTGNGTAAYTVNAQYNSTFSTNTWYHLCGTWSSKSGRVRLYVNGEMVAENNNVPSQYNNGGSVMNLVYGGDWTISDFRIYDNELTPKDAKEVYWGKILEITPQWVDKDRIMDASGFQFPLTPHNITTSGNLAQFNGSSSYIGFNSPNISGGTVSMWVNIPAKPNAQRFLYYDPVSKMLIAFSTDGNIHLGGDASTQPRYSTTGITWKQLTHIVGVWNASRKPSAIYINGANPSTGKTTYWSTGGTDCAIGRRLNASTADYLSGSVNEVKVFSSQLTAADVQELYAMGPNKNDWTEEKPDIWRNMYLEYSGCTWLKVLHHNAPATNLFTTANRKNNDDENLFSRLGLFDDTTMFKMTNGKYQFMVREKLESTSTENIGIWTQTSSPTASTIAGYAQIYSSTGSWPRSFGLTHQSANAVFDESGSGWWCACGCSTAYQGGIPGFWGNVKTGYIDLYIRVDDTQFFNNMG